MIEHKPTHEMGPANILTKELNGFQFRNERYDVTKWDIPKAKSVKWNVKLVEYEK